MTKGYFKNPNGWWPHWRSELGIWSLINTKWFRISGTTPRNANFWTLAVESPRLDRYLWIDFQGFKYLAINYGPDYGHGRQLDWEFGYHKAQCRECRSYCADGFCTCLHRCKRVYGRIVE